MLARLDPELRAACRFPLGSLTKDAVRRLARDAGLPVADKRESQDLCFVAGLGGRAFLRRHGGARLRERRPDRGPRRPRARPPRGPARVHGRPAPRPRRRRARAALRAGQGRGLGHRDGRSRARRWPPPACASRTPGCTARRTRSRACGCATTPSRCPARPARRRRERSSSTWTNRLTRSLPGSSAASCDDDCVVGEGTIGEPA